MSYGNLSRFQFPFLSKSDGCFLFYVYFPKILLFWFLFTRPPPQIAFVLPPVFAQKNTGYPYGYPVFAYFNQPCMAFRDSSSLAISS